ncbi:unnamed protein product [Brassica rapa]|uniref:Uncharacterized protein n=2 Tax=Brassica TaxID=3705 RepID=A0A8D9HK41_BRACM|nr:unnamed protein product [Brassica napus]CAG7901218.1 unnamed protein product [Brassica rapa]
MIDLQPDLQATSNTNRLIRCYPQLLVQIREPDPVLPELRPTHRWRTESKHQSGNEDATDLPQRGCAMNRRRERSNKWREAAGGEAMSAIDDRSGETSISNKRRLTEK